MTCSSTASRRWAGCQAWSLASSGGVTPGPLGYGVGDTVMAGGTECSIGAIKIGHGVTESTTLTSYGFVGRSIKSLTIAGQKRTLPAPVQTAAIDGTDVRIHVLPVSLS